MYNTMDYAFLETVINSIVQSFVKSKCTKNPLKYNNIAISCNKLDTMSRN